MHHEIKIIYRENAPFQYGVFPTSPSRFNGEPIVRFGTQPISVHDDEAQAIQEVTRLGRRVVDGVHM